MLIISFSQKIKEDILVASARHCSVCHRYKGVKVEVHHITPVDKDGEDTYENAIALCFDCHADAGHYYAKHPRGTKLSPSELKKHKEAWNKIVKENNIQEYKDINLIHSAYYIAKNSDIINEISNGDLSKFPNKNVIIHNNYILKFQRNFLQDYQFSPGFERINDFPIEEIKNYLLQYPNAEEIDKNIYPKYLYKRIPKKEEVDKFCKEDSVCRFLLKAGEEIKNIFQIFTYVEECGERPTLQEILIKRDIWAVYLYIANISDFYLNINSINLKGNFSFNNCMNFKLFMLESKAFKLKLPNMQIPPKKSILIPLLTLLAPFKGDEIEEYSSVEEYNYDQAQVLSHGKLQLVKNSSSFLVLGPSINPYTINIKVNGNTVKQEIHKFDFSNLFLIKRYWMCGCCPYIFFKTGNNIQYYCEVFQKAADLAQYFKIIVPEGFQSCILSELEHETTFISFIKINGKIIFNDKKLNKDESLEFSVHKADVVEGFGFYSLIHINIKSKSPKLKNEIIKKFIQKKVPV